MLVPSRWIYRREERGDDAVLSAAIDSSWQETMPRAQNMQCCKKNQCDFDWIFPGPYVRHLLELEPLVAYSQIVVHSHNALYLLNNQLEGVRRSKLLARQLHITSSVGGPLDHRQLIRTLSRSSFLQGPTRLQPGN